MCGLQSMDLALKINKDGYLRLTKDYLNNHTTTELIKKLTAIGNLEQFQNDSDKKQYLEALNLSKLPKLEALDISNTNLGGMSIDKLQALGLSLSKLTQLRILDISNNNLGGMSIEQLQALGLSNLTHLHSLNLSYNYLGSMSLEKLKALDLDKLTKLKALDLSWNNLNGMKLEQFKEFGRNNLPNCVMTY